MSKKEKKTEGKTMQDKLDESRKYMNLFNKAKTFNSERIDSYAELMAFFQGNQYLLKRYKTDQPWIVNMNTPYSSVAIENRVSSLLSSDYQGELLPLAAEDVDVVDALDAAQNREWGRLELDNYVREAIARCAVVREAYVHLYLNKDKRIGGRKSKKLGRLEAYFIDPSKVFIDPTARNLRDAEYIFISDRINSKKAIKKYPMLENLQMSVADTTPQDRGEIYYENDYETEQENIFTMLTYYGKCEGEKIKRVTLVNSVIVDEKEMPISVFPIAQLRCKKAADSCYGLSLMDDVLSLQKAVNAIESAITNTAVAYAAPSMMVRKGCGVDPKTFAKANGAPGVVVAVEGNLDNAIKPIVPPKIESAILDMRTTYRNEIDRVTGNTSQFLGDIGTAGNTSSGADRAVERATIIEINMLKNIEEFVEDLTNILVQYIIELYSGETLTYNDGKKTDDIYEFVEVEVPKKDDMEGLEYKYKIELDKKTPYSKEKQRQLLLELFQFERQYDTPVKSITAYDIIKNSDLENKEEILARFNQLNKQSSEEKASAIEQLFMTSVELGIPNELVTAATTEIISGQKETPALDQLMEAIKQGFQAQVQEQQAQLDAQEQAAQQEQQMMMNSQALSEEEMAGINASPDAIKMAQQQLMGQ